MAHPDLDLLLNTLIPAAESLVRDHGTFHPFGAYLDNEGEIVQVDAEHTDESPPQILESVSEKLGEAAEAGKARATALCMDVLVVPPDREEKTDAIGIRLEHVEGEAVEVFMPYRKEPEVELVPDELFATPGYRSIFGGGEEAEVLTERYGFPDDLDGRTLAQLAHAGSDLEKPHKMEFFLYFPSQDAAEGIGESLSGEGYEVELRSDEEGEEWLCFAKRALVPEHAELARLRERFTMLCEAAGGQYDGWGAEIVEPSW